MNFDFNDFNFEVIDITIYGIAELIVNKNSINFSQKVADGLGNPTHIKTMIDTNKKVFAIQGCKPSDVNAVKFSKPKGEQRGGVTISTSAIRTILKTLMEDKWDNCHRYKIPAKIFADSKIAVFYLDTATEHEQYNVHRNIKNKV